MTYRSRVGLAVRGIKQQNSSINGLWMKNLTVIVPCRNEAQAIPVLLRLLEQAAIERSLSLRVVIVDDGSDDDTCVVAMSTAEQLHGASLQVDLITLARPSGKDAAILCAMASQECASEFVAVMDGDGQHPVSSLMELMDIAQAGAYVVVAEPKSARGGTAFRRLVHMTSTKFLSRESIRTDFSVLRSDLVPDVVAMMRTGDAYRDALTWLAAPVEKVDYDMGKRLDGSASRFTFSAFVGLGARRALSRGREIVIALTFLRMATIGLCGVVAVGLYVNGRLNVIAIVVLMSILLLIAAVSEVFLVFVTLSIYARGTPRPRYQVARSPKMREFRRMSN